ncbi:cytochrome C oxidase subunit IV family protein [endosymbiont of Lamellibrachia barhami]|uniref:cytochrome C oxidase subunit IV family protein n=1 Tax=endosymbiont of Lamellibrachia barhami TaxID=205975 RepID=UPI0015ABA520|nr:cytochrome C oxidase subunit IV family protein [endosymbiont of Lamellibrachia barhami]
MFTNKSIDFVWIQLMLLTLLSAFIAETADTGLVVIIIVAVTIGYKGRMIVDHFMELINANRYIRASMRLYFYVIPLMIVLTYLFPEAIVHATTLR